MENGRFLARVSADAGGGGVVIFKIPTEMVEDRGELEVSG
jgi:hypothetical protein